MLQAFVTVRTWLDQRLSIKRWYRLWMLPKAWVLTILQVFVIGSLVTINLVIHTWGVLRRSRMWLIPLILLYFLCFNPVHAHYFRNYSDQGKTYLFLHFKLKELAFTLKKRTHGVRSCVNVNYHWQHWFFSENQRFKWGQLLLFFSSFAVF